MTGARPAGVCPHGRQLYYCIACGGKGWCRQHRCWRATCVQCGPPLATALCALHPTQRRNRCPCRRRQSASHAQRGALSTSGSCALTFTAADGCPATSDVYSGGCFVKKEPEEPDGEETDLGLLFDSTYTCGICSESVRPALRIQKTDGICAVLQCYACSAQPVHVACVAETPWSTKCSVCKKEGSMKPAKPGGSFQAAQGAAGTACIEIKDGENANDPKTPENANHPWYDGKGGVCRPWYERTGNSPVLSAYPSPVIPRARS